MDDANAFLNFSRHNNDQFPSATIHIKITLDGSFILPHQKRNTTTNQTYYVISMNDEHVYDMLATPESLTRTQLRTLINIRDTNHALITHI